ncbi:hypothetical protein DDZ14_08350 [Maritimibacter sp. 55A14]|uniref:hypothetical protein n=1 Tax=Maritimibacter sp. 55A14 TaxID=2174844 RepID=UPI000D60FDEC|nr:hypothetical protein [Maritimibacter sp. 55A14]PWE32747.1 hypothetical protein DDZ14_08350 [Maritimibacter sp. 55A14]
MPLYTVKNTHGHRVTVRLDGREIKDVIEADTDAGYLIRLQPAKSGQRTPVREKLVGRVEVEVE